MASAEGTTQSVEKVQVNFATEKELRTLHGVGSAISKAIVEIKGKGGELMSRIPSTHTISVCDTRINRGNGFLP